MPKMQPNSCGENTKAYTNKIGSEGGASTKGFSGALTTGQKFDNLAPDNKIELLEVGH